MSESRESRSVNDNSSLWSHIGGLDAGVETLRKYRRTACPVEGDDDVDDFDDDSLPDGPPTDTPPGPPADDDKDDKK